MLNGNGDMPNVHDILTGSMPDGRAYTDGMDHTCGNYTSNADGKGQVQLGHHDKSRWRQWIVELGARQPRLRAAESGPDGRRWIDLLLRARQLKTPFRGLQKARGGFPGPFLFELVSAFDTHANIPPVSAFCPSSSRSLPGQEPVGSLRIASRGQPTLPRFDVWPR